MISGKFLRFMVSHRGIKSNPEKIQAIRQMDTLKMVREVQWLTGRVIVLNRFISRSVEQGLPFFYILKNPKDFQWIDEYQKAFEELKNYLSTPSLLSKLETS